MLTVNGKEAISDVQLQTAFKGPKKIKFDNFEEKGQFKVSSKEKPIVAKTTWQDIPKTSTLEDTDAMKISIELDKDNEFHTVTVEFKVGGDLTFGWGYRDGINDCYVQENEDTALVDNVVIDYDADEASV